MRVKRMVENTCVWNCILGWMEMNNLYVWWWYYVGKVVRAIVLKKGLPWKTAEDLGKDTS